MNNNKDYESQMILLWLSKEWGESLKIMHEGREFFEDTLHYQILKLKYIAAPITLQFNRMVNKFYNVLRRLIGK